MGSRELSTTSPMKVDVDSRYERNDRYARNEYRTERGARGVRSVVA